MNSKIPSRREAIADFKKIGTIACVFPIHYPRALLRAHNILPVETWGPPQADLTLADAHLQSYTCSVARYGLSYLLSGGFDVAQMFLVPHCCDTLQGLGSILLDFISTKQRTYTFYVPRSRRKIDIEYFSSELSALNRDLTEVSGQTPDDDKLFAALKIEEQASRDCSELFKSRRNLPLGNREFYSLVRSREYLPAEMFSKISRKVLDAKNEEASHDIPIVLSGVVPGSAEMLDALCDMGVTIVDDDCLSTGRRIYPPSHLDDPLSQMADSILSGPPDSTLGASLLSRQNYIKKKVHSSGAKGVIFYQMKFCEPEQFYLPALRKSLGQAGIPNVVIEAEIGDRLSNQVITRLEAFVELIS